LLSHHYVCEQFIFIKAKRPRRQSEVGVIITMITMHFPRAAFSLYRIFPLAACRLPLTSALSEAFTFESAEALGKEKREN